MAGFSSLLRRALAERLARGESRAFATAELRGLPMDEASRMTRAREMGFDTETPLYHGTNQPFESFNLDRGGAATKSESSRLGAWLSDSPETASIYAENAGRTVVPNVEAHEPAVAAARANVERLERLAQRTGNWDEYERAMAAWEQLELDAIRADDLMGQNVTPLLARMRKPKTMDFGGDGLQGYPGADFADAIRAAREEGHDAVILNNLRDPPHAPASTHVVVFDPSNIRSQFAAFDPSRSNRRNLLAGLAVAAPVGAMSLREALLDRSQL